MPAPAVKPGCQESRGYLKAVNQRQKPLAPFLFGPEHSASVRSMGREGRGSLLQAVEGVPRPPFNKLTSDTERPFAAHWEKTHNTPLTQHTMLHHH
ncbi:hypothetical protein PBY51_013683 [Eleginops maclovinus]|uniref:Uncharacterized protein n=1 Tax=Eleginops maclovinus TaxID=56733 RepID=A0AAN7Y5I8_ELEMC|nr:hypothetical protein PBY51_013683 [Eleginops maclovinus]